MRHVSMENLPPPSSGRIFIPSFCITLKETCRIKSKSISKNCFLILLGFDLYCSYPVNDYLFSFWFRFLRSSEMMPL